LDSVPALENKPYLGEDPDLERLLGNFLMLNQTRVPGFSGPGALRLSDIVTLFEAEDWAAAEMELIDYVKIMLHLDSALITFHAERGPTGK
jgi:hypothetical protein